MLNADRSRNITNLEFNEHVYFHCATVRSSSLGLLRRIVTSSSCLTAPHSGLTTSQLALVERCGVRCSFFVDVSLADISLRAATLSCDEPTKCSLNDKRRLEGGRGGEPHYLSPAAQQFGRPFGFSGGLGACE